MSYEINLIEGERGKAHITSDDARTENALMFGVGRKVYNMDNAFEASMTDNNTVRITSGVFYDNGMFIRIDRDKYVEVTIENGLPGTYRNDLICIRYERNIQTQLESASIVVKKGEASKTAAVDPAYTEGDVLDLEVHLDEFPLYRVSLNGLTPTLEPMFVVEDVMSNISLYEELVEHMQDDNNPAGTKHVPAGGKADQVIKWKADGEGEWGDVPHYAIDKTNDSSTDYSPSAGGTFKVIDQVVRDDNGHVIKVNNKTITLPKTSVVVDSSLSLTSVNSVQNKVVTAALNEQANTSDYIKYIMNQANKTWVMPSSYSIELIDIGRPDASKYPPISYVHQDMYYLDVETGEVYEPVETDTGHIWQLYESLQSVRESIISTSEELSKRISSAEDAINKVSTIYWDESYGLVFVTADKSVRYVSKQYVIKL